MSSDPKMCLDCDWNIPKTFGVWPKASVALFPQSKILGFQFQVTCNNLPN